MADALKLMISLNAAHVYKAKPWGIKVTLTQNSVNQTRVAEDGKGTSVQRP